MTSRDLVQQKLTFSYQLSCTLLLIYCPATFVDVRVTHIDDSFPVANQKVPEQTSLVEVAQPNHVIYAINGRGVHVLQGAVLFLDLVLLRFIL